MIAHDPLQRSGRAALPHPALALGDDAEANERVGVTDASGRQPPGDIPDHPAPQEKGNGGLSRDAQDVLRSYPWPVNIRELANAVERALILAEGNLLTATHFGLDGGRHQRLEGTSGPTAEPSAPEAFVDLERRAILTALERTKGNKTQAAAILGITRTKLHTRLKRFGLAPESAV